MSGRPSTTNVMFLLSLIILSIDESSHWGNDSIYNATMPFGATFFAAYSTNEENGTYEQFPTLNPAHIGTSLASKGRTAPDYETAATGPSPATDTYLRKVKSLP